MTSFSPEIARFLDAKRVARLATADRRGAPHVIPICYASNANHIYSAIDLKPKRVSGKRLKRIRNIQQNPKVAIVVDEYSERWSELCYVLIQGNAEILEHGDERKQAELMLRERYPQYRDLLEEGCTILKITPKKVTAWGRLE